MGPFLTANGRGFPRPFLNAKLLICTLLGPQAQNEIISLALGASEEACFFASILTLFAPKPAQVG